MIISNGLITSGVQIRLQLIPDNYGADSAVILGGEQFHVRQYSASPAFFWLYDHLFVVSHSAWLWKICVWDYCAKHLVVSYLSITSLSR